MERMPELGTLVSCFSRKNASVALLPARPLPLSAWIWPVDPGRMRINASPPTPFMCGRTTASTPAMVIAASTAFPPRFNTSMPAADASTWSDVTAPSMPPTSGRMDGSWATDGPAAAASTVSVLSAREIVSIVSTVKLEFLALESDDVSRCRGLLDEPDHSPARLDERGGVLQRRRATAENLAHDPAFVFTRNEEDHRPRAVEK